MERRPVVNDCKSHKQVMDRLTIVCHMKAPEGLCNLFAILDAKYCFYENVENHEYSDWSL